MFRGARPEAMFRVMRNRRLQDCPRNGRKRLLPASIATGHGHDGRMGSSLESIAIGHGPDGRMESSLESLATGNGDNGREHAMITAKRNITMARADARKGMAGATHAAGARGSASR